MPKDREKAPVLARDESYLGGTGTDDGSVALVDSDVPTFAVLEEALSADEERQVDATVRFLHETALRHGIEHAVEVRDHVLGTYFDGDFAAFSDSRRNKSRSFRSLCEREDLPYKFATLYSLVRVGQQVDELPAGVGRALSPTHHRALLPLLDAEAKVRLAREAVDRELTVAQLEERVRANKPKSNAGRPALPPLVKQGHAVRRALAAVQLPTEDEVAALDDEARAALAEALSEALSRLQGLVAALVG